MGIVNVYINSILSVAQGSNSNLAWVGAVGWPWQETVTGNLETQPTPHHHLS